jgi:hypothetical protein
MLLEPLDAGPKQSLYELLGLPDQLVTLSASVALSAIFAAILLKQLVLLGRQFNLTNQGRAVVAITATPFILALFPIFPNEEFARSNLPFCHLGLGNAGPLASEVYWYSESERGSIAELARNGEVYLPVEAEGQTEAVWGEQSVSHLFRFRVTNRFGSCIRELRVWNPINAQANELRCEVSVSPSEASRGDEYVLTWQVNEESAAIFINGSEVEAAGQKTFTFSAENYSRFRLVANLEGRVCEAEAMILASDVR